MQYADLPSVDSLVSELNADTELPRAVVVAVCREAIDEARAAIDRGDEADPLSTARARLIAVAGARPTQVINATGVLLHTNLGRASLGDPAATAAKSLMTGAGNVEVDLATGRRSKRTDYLAALIPAVTGAEAGTAVNNAAGALLLSLAALAGRGGRVAVSRGELIEIGGSFRLPDLMAASGAELVEVGTTNRTRISDFASVIEDVDAVLKVHPSNYRVEGFHEEVTHQELIALATSAGTPFIYDVGSGLIDDAAPWLGDAPRAWLSEEPGVRQVIADGVDLTLFSGDKLLGGPQAGIIAGSADLVARVAKHPIARAVRLDGPTIAALAHTLELYADRRVLEIPFWAMAAMSVEAITDRAAAAIEGTSGCNLVPDASVPGAGTVPGETIPTMTIVLDGDADRHWQALAARGIVATRRDGHAVLDLRSVQPSDDHVVRSALLEIIG